MKIERIAWSGGNSPGEAALRGRLSAFESDLRQVSERNKTLVVELSDVKRELQRVEFERDSAISARQAKSAELAEEISKSRLLSNRGDALQRVGEELAYAHPDLSDELRLINLELRAGKARSEALRNLADRTGVDDLSSLAAMLIQTDKFGTSVAQSLRVHSDTLRTKRRQRAEEAAAKTGVKMVFPLVFCIFPAIWVVTIGPAAIKFVQVLFPLAQQQ